MSRTSRGSESSLPGAELQKGELIGGPAGTKLTRIHRHRPSAIGPVEFLSPHILRGRRGRLGAQGQPTSIFQPLRTNGQRLVSIAAANAGECWSSSPPRSLPCQHLATRRPSRSPARGSNGRRSRTASDGNMPPRLRAGKCLSGTSAGSPYCCALSNINDVSSRADR